MPGPFDRFDNDAKRALALAQDEAVRFGHTWLGTEHLMIALMRVGGTATSALTSCGIELTAARAATLRILPRVEQTPSEVTLTPRMKEILERAKRTTAQQGAVHVTPSALLLALIADADGVGSQVLAQLGATPEKVRKAVDRLTPPS